MKPGDKVYKGWAGVVEEYTLLEISQPPTYSVPVWTLKDKNDKIFSDYKTEDYSSTRVKALERELVAMQECLDSSRSQLKLALREIPEIMDIILDLKKELAAAKA